MRVILVVLQHIRKRYFETTAGVTFDHIFIHVPVEQVIRITLVSEEVN